MSEDKKIKKKIDSKINGIKLWLKNIEETCISLETCNDPKEQKKLEKKYNNYKNFILSDGEALAKLGGNIQEALSTDLTPYQKKALQEVFPLGLGQEAVAYQRQREETIAKLKKDITRIKKIRLELEPYTNLPIEQKMKNKLFRKEASFGRVLNIYSNKNDIKWYNPAWNFKEHIDTSPEFTPEEIQVLKECYQIYLEEEEWSQEHNPIRQFGRSLYKFGEKVEEHSNKREAIQWATNLYTDLFPDVVKELFATHPLTEEQLVQQSKNMTKRYIRWATDPVEVQKLLNEKALIEVENKAQIEAFKRDTDLSDVKVRGLIGNLVKNSIGKMLSQMYGNEEVLLFALLKERLGIEKTYFLMIYTLNENSQRASELFSQYSFAELGLE